MSETFKDSGKRAEFATGAVRDTAEHKGRFDLLPADAIRQLARVYETGSQKYGDRNWERGIPLWRYLDSGLRHLCCLLAGMTDEPHGPMALWNIAGLIQTEIWIRRGKLPESLREGFPFRIRLLPTGDVEAFAQEPAAAPAPPEDSVPAGFFDQFWLFRCQQCGTINVVPLADLEYCCNGCGLFHLQPGHEPASDLE